ncbi:LysR family transcriptional regulator [Pseudoalteromonas sp. DL2-H2.2]|uniref:LysR family transcriptional regulator n=1 Tax=Pseudoalteromonas sp. DL2-H2.2 TaxID=2908889 RepID=UPI001F4034FC|nr:LysR family transcriptional regulator [Pseudoalteromonas sp. DL2-H2.2]MCF2907744.1 LysR family transcriptional regulator [Pseudoalteromonas sp. DL2-H2.2]
MLDDLLLFVEVARRGSFAKAADALSLSAPTISKRIAALEARLGYSLLNRSARGVLATSHGQVVYEKMAPSLLALQADSTALLSPQVSAFHLLCPQNLINGPLYPVVESFQRTHPDLVLHIEPDNTNVLLSQKRFDVIIRVGTLQDSNCYHTRIGEIALKCVVPEQAKETNTLFMPFKKEQIPDSALWRDLVSRFDHLSYVGDITLARQMVASGLGAAVLPMTEVAELNKPFSYVGEWQHVRPVYALWANAQQPPPLTQAFITLLRQAGQCSDVLRGNLVDVVSK